MRNRSSLTTHYYSESLTRLVWRQIFDTDVGQCPTSTIKVQRHLSPPGWGQSVLFEVGQPTFAHHSVYIQCCMGTSSTWGTFSQQELAAGTRQLEDEWNHNRGNIVPLLLNWRFSGKKRWLIDQCCYDSFFNHWNQLLLFQPVVVSRCPETTHKFLHQKYASSVRVWSMSASPFGVVSY